MAVLPVKVKYSRAQSWRAVNPLLPNGERGIERDTWKQKIGDGIRRWNDLPYEPYGYLTNVPFDAEFETSTDSAIQFFRLTIPDGRVAKIDYDVLAAGEGNSGYGEFGNLIYQAVGGSLIALVTASNSGTNPPVTPPLGNTISTMGNDLIMTARGLNGERFNWLASFEIRWVDMPTAGGGGGSSSGSGSGSGSGSAS